jgi:hypothetical protein
VDKSRDSRSERGHHPAARQHGGRRLSEYIFELITDAKLAAAMTAKSWGRLISVEKAALRSD